MRRSVEGSSKDENVLYIKIMKTFLKKSFYALAAIVVFIITFFLCLWIWGAWHDEWSGYNASIYISDGICNIAVVPIVGDLTTFDIPTDAGLEASSLMYTNADDVRAFIRQAEVEPEILGVLARIDSPGGLPVASEIVADEIQRSFLPNVALIRESGTSGGYLAATGADTIIASPFSDVGGIGITMSYVENWKQNNTDGLGYVSLSSAPFKDYGDPNKPLTSEERALIERDLQIWHEQFIQHVADNRNISVDEVTKLADGSSMPGTLALESGLIDSLGDQETAREWFAQELGLPKSEVIFCE